MDMILELLKIDLGISHNQRDPFFNALITTCIKEIEDKGVSINVALTEDLMLVSDYAAWRYRKRQEDIPMAQNLQWRIRNRIVKGRALNVPKEYIT